MFGAAEAGQIGEWMPRFLRFCGGATRVKTALDATGRARTSGCHLPALRNRITDPCRKVPGM